MPYYLQIVDVILESNLLKGYYNCEFSTYDHAEPRSEPQRVPPICVNALEQPRLVARRISGTEFLAKLLRGINVFNRTGLKSRRLKLF